MKLAILLTSLAATTATYAEDWSGWYIGVETGQTWASRTSLVAFDTTYADSWSIGLVGGNLVSTNSGWLVGFEAKAGVSDLGRGLPAGFSRLDHTRLYASVSARAAIPFDRFLPYASAGFRANYVHSSADWEPWPGFQTAGEIKGFGIVPLVAVGLEAAIVEGVSAKFEATFAPTGIVQGQDNGAQSNYWEYLTLNAGLNYRF